jgi:predicted permease
MPRSFRGVAPPGFPRDLWTPLTFTGESRGLEQDREATSFEVYGRVGPGTTVAAAAADVRIAGAELQAAYPETNTRFGDVRLFPVSGLGGFQGMSVLMPVVAFLALLGVIATVVLLVGCANIAGLLLGRAAARRREIAVRLSLGAGRGRLVRQLLTESLMLALAGGVLGVALSAWLTGLVPLATRSLPFPVEFDFAVDGRVLVYALSLAGGAAILCGLAPARRAARTSLVEALKLDTGGAGKQRLRTALVIGQISACAALLVWGGLFTRSLANASQVDPGFVADGVLLAEVPIGDISGPEPGARAQAVQQLHERIRALPAVESTGMAFAVPLALSARAEYEIRISTERGESRLARVMGNTVTPGYFDTIRVQRRAGRDFNWQDAGASSLVAIVNETAARRFWNGQAVGQHIQLPDRERWVSAEIVGVVADSKYWTLGEEIAPTVYQPYGQGTSGNTLFVRTRTLARTREAIATELRTLAPAQPVEIRLMTDAIAISTLPARIGALATTAFGVLAMLLSAMGIYGMVAFSVAQRTREIGVRKALGATTGTIVGHVLRGSVTRSAVALLLGAAAGSLAASLFGGFIVGVSNFDVPTLAAVAALVLGATVMASLAPALRAARIDPVTTLRAD